MPFLQILIKFDGSFGFSRINYDICFLLNINYTGFQLEKLN